MHTGRVVEIDQRIDPKSYHKIYQRKWRREHPHYYRDLKRKMKSQESNHMKKTMKQEVEELKIEITRLQNVIADLEMNLQNDSSQNAIQNEEITSVYSVPSTQACSEKELLQQDFK